MLTQDDIKKVRDSAKTITIEDGLAGRIKPVKPVDLSNGYRAGMTINIMIPPNSPMEHLSVHNPKGTTDTAEAEHIAKDILGEGYFALGPMNFKNVLHFMKPIKKEAGKK